MKKKVLCLLVIICVLFMNLGKVSADLASTITVGDVNTKFLECISDPDYTISNENNRISISLINPTYGPYSINFDYTDRAITYVNSRDVSSASDELKTYYASSDNYFVTLLLLALYDVYNVDLDSIPEDIDYAEMGVDFIDGEMLSYENEDGGRISGNAIELFSVKLNDFNNFAQSYQSDTDNSESISHITTLYKLMMDPMADSILANSFDGFDDFVDNVSDDHVSDSNNPGEVTAAPTERVKVPSTSADAKNLILGIFILAIASGIGAYVCIMKTVKK